MAALTICTCTLNVKDALGAKFTTAELVVEPRKSQIHSGDAVYINRPQRVTADTNGLCTLALSETTTDSQQVIFTLNWDDAGKNSGSVIFDPTYIPNQASLDLSTILTVSRG